MKYQTNNNNCETIQSWKKIGIYPFLLYTLPKLFKKITINHLAIDKNLLASRNKNVIPIFVLVKNLFPTSRFHPVYSTVCHCEIFLGERNSFSFHGVIVKSTFDLVNARPRSFDDVQPDRDANTLVKPWARKARSLGTRSKAWNTIRIESTGILRVERFVDSILPQQIFPPVLFRATICFVKGRFFARKLDHLSSL